MSFSTYSLKQKNSNTTNVKVKRVRPMPVYSVPGYSNTTNVKVKLT